MLAVATALRDGLKDEKKQGEIEFEDGFTDFFDSIDFDDLFSGDDVLPELLSEGFPTEGDSSSSSSSNNNNNNNSNNKVTGERGDGISSKNKTSKTSSANGKRKVKVDWTPELHRRFVQAVEELGVEKAVPSRILEIMGIDCLTRHNIASHLQKYRSHRKHLVAREAEAARWSHQRRKRDHHHHHHHHSHTIGFPTLPMPRPLHVWGHPMPPPLRPLLPISPVSPGTPCFPPPPLPLPPPPQLVFPSPESIDAAIGDVIAKPWLPLPLGLKPPCMEGVLGELQRHGLPNLPPTPNPTQSI